MKQPLIRVGVEGGRRAVLARAQELGAPLLVSANSLWDNRRRTFSGFDCYRGFDCALDSGGFVAMKRYGGYRWTSGEYATLAADFAPAWRAQMDHCCEPEIASSPAEVFRRIDLTVAGLHECRAAAAAIGCPAPMPVLQGWAASDYTSGPAFDSGFTWPELVGVGSVCRRHLRGPAGVLAIVGALDAKLPPHVRLHLFGVKSRALGAVLGSFPNRLGSVDSMAYNRAAGWDAFHAGLKSHTNHQRAEAMATWYGRQLGQLQPQPQALLSL